MTLYNTNIYYQQSIEVLGNRLQARSTLLDIDAAQVYEVEAAILEHKLITISYMAKKVKVSARSKNIIIYDHFYKHSEIVKQIQRKLKVCRKHLQS